MNKVFVSLVVNKDVTWDYRIKFENYVTLLRILNFYLHIFVQKKYIYSTSIGNFSETEFCFIPQTFLVQILQSSITVFKKHINIAKTLP